jgi:hypothetical protein
MFTWLPTVMGLAAAVPAARIPTAKAIDLKRLDGFTVTVLVWLSNTEVSFGGAVFVSRPRDLFSKRKANSIANSQASVLYCFIRRQPLIAHNFMSPIVKKIDT